MATSNVAPFEFELNGVSFGLVPNPPDDEDENEDQDWRVTAEPGNYMCFYPPWDGEYDT